MSLTPTHYSVGAITYCAQVGRVPIAKIRESIQSALSISPHETDIVIGRAMGIIRDGIAEIHATYMERLDSEERARQRLRDTNPDLTDQAVEALYQYSCWCVAKGA